LKEANCQPLSRRTPFTTGPNSCVASAVPSEYVISESIVPLYDSPRCAMLEPLLHVEGA
jgi:hypothetical protein